MLLARGALLCAFAAPRRGGAMPARTAVAALGALAVASLGMVGPADSVSWLVRSESPTVVVSIARWGLLGAFAAAMLLTIARATLGWRREVMALVLATALGAALSRWVFDAPWSAPSWLAGQPGLLTHATVWHGAVALAGSALLLRHALRQTRAAFREPDAGRAIRCVAPAVAAVLLCTPQLRLTFGNWEHGTLVIPWADGAETLSARGEQARPELLVALLPWLLAALAASTAAVGFALAAVRSHPHPGTESHEPDAASPAPD
ncbi:MAG: hypothetical protein AB7O84_05820 [Planctomycetota bacterium]